MVLTQFVDEGAANPLQPGGFEVLIMLFGLLLVALPIVLVIALAVLLFRWARSSRVAAATSGELGSEISRRVDSIERRLGGIEKMLNEAGS